MGWGPLVAAILLCLSSSTRAQTVECTVTELDGSTSTLRPGPFVPPAGAASAAAPAPRGACPNPLAVPAASKAPFFLGSATAAYQVEGAAAEGGRGPSIWDTFSHLPGKTHEGDTGDRADDFYHRWANDIALMRSLGLRNFRLSLSWTRLFPNGTVGDLNPEGVAFYDGLFDALRAACIEPWVTLYHWDLPQALQDEYGGWVDERIVEDFAAYAQAAFDLFGDRVKYWFTLNEPETFCPLGYETGTFAPGRCSDRTRCLEGNSSTEPHLCAYHAVLAHAAAVSAFRQGFCRSCGQACSLEACSLECAGESVPGGQIGMTNAIGWAAPYTGSAEDVAAAERQQSFTGAWFLDPLYRGDWPAERKAVYGDLLPSFTPEQRRFILDNPQDFIALQHYTGNYVYQNATNPPLLLSSTTKSSDGYQLPQADSPWLFVFPKALRSLLGWLHRRYGAPIIITENGVSAPGEASKPVLEVLCDQFRLSYFQQYISNATAAKRDDGVDLRGYFAWSLLDNFEWADGYSKRFGITYVDFDSLARYYKASAMWLSSWFGMGAVTSAAGA
ncbi:hypothetical protein CHLNCDRAFT_50621 [Chlorella variabilis]|uniref:beta-glucosidase n=1 Tax=Chlorella variabilis TaxID=554065 RepID=E1Z7R0_CHLVA|nr:hypothetical protein CHLNCDRAFT_50621 [Chlorella variabilis]EFN57961.1 hypothetical protein CHLNCDRAFT_50621 [Chlorella variabilis]|eukprot:XP_005850063.1 hypothetical protein CHLNCDRAFT_50621 [Chlorella variabilis]